MKEKFKLLKWLRVQFRELKFKFTLPPEVLEVRSYFLKKHGLYGPLFVDVKRELFKKNGEDFIGICRWYYLNYPFKLEAFLYEAYRGRPYSDPLFQETIEFDNASLEMIRECINSLEDEEKMKADLEKESQKRRRQLLVDVGVIRFSNGLEKAIRLSEKIKEHDK